MHRVSTLQRDFGHRFGSPAELEQPPTWTGDWVRHRLAEAFAIERRIPDRRIGPAIVKGAWANIPTSNSFADVVAQGEAPRRDIWEAWARAGGATAAEISRMEEALSWPGAILANGGGFPVEARCLLAWGYCAGYGRSVRAVLRQRRWSRSTFYRSVADGAERIADRLNASGTAVR